MKPKTLHKIFFYLLVAWGLVLFSNANAAVYQWSVTLPTIVSSETNSHPTAYLWIPEHCNQVRAVVFGQHNMCEETLFDHPDFREKLSELGFAIVWLTPGINQQWKIEDGCQQAFDQMMNDLAAVSGYSELKNVPIVPLGHSAMATFPWNFAAWNNERTLAVISYHGDAPRTNLTGYGRENLEWGRNRNIDGIPGLMIEGEFEWWEARVRPALAFRMMYPESCVSFLCDAGHGHFDVSDEVVDYIGLFLEKTAKYRLPYAQPIDGKVTLNTVDPQYGWLAERWHPNQTQRAKTAPVADYAGDIHDAFWYFDQEIAEATEQYYAREHNKKNQYLGFKKENQLLFFDKNLHSQIETSINLKRDGLDFHLKAIFTDSLHQKEIKEHSSNPPLISIICGPVKEINDTTFSVWFNRVGFDNFKRSGGICMLASSCGDETYKSTVQQVSIKVPINAYKYTWQQMNLNSLKNVTIKEKAVKLNPKVNYYVKQGPAEIQNNKLVFTNIPPRSKFPIEVTVVAWQFDSKCNQIKYAEHSFVIND